MRPSHHLRRKTARKWVIWYEEDEVDAYTWDVGVGWEGMGIKAKKLKLGIGNWETKAVPCG